MNKKDFGLFRDDGLGILRTTTGPETDRKRKSIIKIFKECGLSITYEVNKKIVDFLGVRFNVNGKTYETCRKPNNEPVYINIQSNHPPNIMADIPKAIFKRLTNISCNKSVFDRNVDISDTPFKESYENHKTPFRHRSHLTASDLFKYYWKLVDNGAVTTIKFSVAKCVKGNTFINNCNLCLSEKAFIIRNQDDVNMLNKRSEFISKYRHINKRLLNRVKDDRND